MGYQSTKIIELGSCAFRQWRAESHCKYIHGYRLVAKFWFSANELDHRNWVVDFGGLKELKSKLENQFDHTFCVAGDDPHLELFQQLHNARVCDLRIMEEGVGIEKTAEWCFKIADAHIRDITNNRCWVEQVEVWEHEKNSAIYTVKKSGCCKDSSKYTADQFEFNFIKTEPTAQHTVLPLEQTPVANTVAAPAPEIQEAVKDTGAAVGNKITTGWGNPFGGTSWGA